MIKRLILAVVLCCASSSWAAISLHSSVLTSNATTSATTQTSGATMAVTTGDVIMVTVGFANGAATTGVSSVTDSIGGNTYIKRSNCIQSNTVREEMWYVVSGGTSASTSVTINYGAGSVMAASAISYSGVTAVGAQTGTTVSSANPSVSITTVNNNNWCVTGLVANTNASMTALTGNLRANTSQTGVRAATVDNTVASPGTCTTAVTDAATLYAVGQIELRTVALPTGKCASCDLSELRLPNHQ